MSPFATEKSEPVRGDTLPGRLAGMDEARKRHAAKVDFMTEMLDVGDPLADAVILEINEFGAVVKQQLNRGLMAGVSALDDPFPAVAALLRDMERVPEWFVMLRPTRPMRASQRPIWRGKRRIGRARRSCMKNCRRRKMRRRGSGCGWGRR